METKKLTISEEYIKEITGLEIEIISAEEKTIDPLNKARYAIPGKPAFYLFTKGK